MTIVITHPGARLLVPCLEVLADVVAGDWTTAARLCNRRLGNPDACASDLDDLAARAGMVRTQRHPYRYRLGHRILLVDEHPSLLAAALDLHTQLMMGLWDTLEQVTPPTRRPARGWRAVELLDARIRHQLPDTWPMDPYASQSVFSAPPVVRLVHHVLSELDGRMRCGYEVPAGYAAVRVG